jgi:hypothetical protein
MRAKSILLSKTFWVNLVATLLALLEVTQVTNLLGPGGIEIVLGITGVINVVLRTWTTTAVEVRGTRATDAGLTE